MVALQGEILLEQCAGIRLLFCSDNCDLVSNLSDFAGPWLRGAKLVSRPCCQENLLEETFQLPDEQPICYPSF